MTTVLEGRHKGLTLEGPEYETIYVFGGLCMVDATEKMVPRHFVWEARTAPFYPYETAKSRKNRLPEPPLRRPWDGYHYHRQFLCFCH
ncbi:MAG: hypothetical protein JEZ11_07175 [Desulfobacterales bacterium]|nr:hypothetical protein [Desulfobacterales bacterium]